MYEDRTQNYDAEIHEEYLTLYMIHPSPATSFVAMCKLQHIIYKPKHN